MPKMVITLDTESLPHIAYSHNGVIREFHTNHDNVLQYLESAAAKEVEKADPFEVVLHTPALPPNTVKYARTNRGTQTVFFTYGETSHDASFLETKYKSIPFPNLVYGFVVTPKMFMQHGMYVAAYKGDTLRDDTPLYRYPYSNVNASGSMCYYDSHPIKDLVQLQTFPHIWANMANNTHLYNQGHTNKSDKPLRELFEELNGQPDFPYDILTPMDKTFGEWSNGIAQIK